MSADTSLDFVLVEEPEDTTASGTTTSSDSTTTPATPTLEAVESVDPRKDGSGYAAWFKKSNIAFASSMMVTEKA